MNKIDELQMKLDHLLEENQRLQEENSSLKDEVIQAYKVNEKKNTLISQISHEIRTPLNVVIGMASIAKDELDNENVVKDNLSEIESSSRILLGIVDNLLDVSALAGGTLKIDANKFDLKEQITGMGMHFYERAKTKGLHFDIHIKGVSEEYLIGDEHRLQQIMGNLFANALRFTPAGGKIDMTVLQGSSSRNRIHMRFILQDTGRGMTEDAANEMFLPFEEKNSENNENYIDYGIGLFVTKQLVEALGGTIQVESHVGEGNKITVDLPFQKTEQQEMNMTDVSNHCVLVVADEDVCVERGEMLADMGITYATASDGYQALDMLGEADSAGKPFNVCMVDMKMKSVYPEALITEIKQIFGKEPIIIATSYNPMEEKSSEIGADYTIHSALFRSTIFDALMMLEKGKIYKEENVSSVAKKYDFAGKRVLVVEDILLNMEVVVKLLSKVNASVVCAENGKEAVMTYMRKPAGYFDCILMDVNMPEMDGYEATKAIRGSDKKDAKQVPIFAMTANAFSEDIAAALKSGMNGHIAKPIDVQLLYRTLNKLFHGFENQEMADELLEKAKDLEQQNTKLKEQAEHDPLTGLYNRYAYEKETYALMHEKEPVGFILLDIDHFKEINDVYGHELGDEVLKLVATTLKKNLRNTDFVVRLGGDEFAIIIQKYGTDKQVLFDKVEAINNSLQNPPEGIPAVTMSAGAAFSDIGYTTELYGNADKALYQTKKNGRNGCTIFDEALWKAEDELERIQHTVDDYMNFTMEGRENMGEMISLIGYRMLEYAVKVQLESRYGSFKQQEIFRDAGFSAGVYVVENYLDASLPLYQFVEQLVALLEQLRIGKLVLHEMDMNTGEAILSVFEDADCSGMNPIGETVCHYDEGFIAGILSAYTKTKYSATEVECWAKGDKVCKFIAKPIE